jgi:hypothetical protein
VTRIAGLRGARESHEPRLLLSGFREDTVTPPESWDGTHGITSWGMDGNDQYGDCGPAATDHGDMAKADDPALLGTLGEPKYSGTLATYFAYGIAQGEPGPNPDEGVDNASWLGFLWKNGLIEGYGEVPLDQIREYAVLFDGLLIACQLSDEAEQEFEAGQPWNWSASEPPDPNDGHDVLLIQYADDGGVTVVTWGALQKCTAAWVEHNVTDAWAILTAEDAKRAGVNWAALIASLQAVHGMIPGSAPPVPAPAAGGCNLLMSALAALLR